MFVELRPIPGFEGLYSVSSDGRVRSEPRTVMRCNGAPMRVRGRWLKPIKRPDRYLFVNLHRGEEQVKLLVHRAVALAWLPEPSPGQDEVNHLDAVRSNNDVRNIEWCTSAENKRHAIAMGLCRFHTPARKAAVARLGLTKRKLSAAQAAEVKALAAAGASRHSIAARFSVAWLTVARLVRGETYL